nr:hypothetical protein CFP56_72971 [Quercus suber]
MDTKAYLTELTELLFEDIEDISPWSRHLLVKTQGVGRCKKQIGEDWHKISHIPNLKGHLSEQEEEPDEE